MVGSRNIGNALQTVSKLRIRLSRMKGADDHKTLGVEPNASRDAVQRAFEVLYAEYDPLSYDDATARELAIELRDQVRAAASNLGVEVPGESIVIGFDSVAPPQAPSPRMPTPDPRARPPTPVAAQLPPPPVGMGPMYGGGMHAPMMDFGRPPPELMAWQHRALMAEQQLAQMHAQLQAMAAEIHAVRERCHNAEAMAAESGRRASAAERLALEQRKKIHSLERLAA